MKTHVKRMKRQLTTWEKMFTNHISNKGFVSRIHKEDPTLAEKKNQLENSQKT